ncbi:hypothetical protein BRADI_2g36789v3 [Brachypodium distachyon]|uniref:Uncharacterized protein n=1 Tax=Brachypodium distachyon TaxID=15368 RepID=A0A2K2DC71_BRADI|nr:hypothetical protein BRADI_2g36789v3 [Brachypodium distachyon]
MQPGSSRWLLSMNIRPHLRVLFKSAKNPKKGRDVAGSQLSPTMEMLDLNFSVKLCFASRGRDCK